MCEQVSVDGKYDLIVECILLITHGDAYAAMMYYSKIGFKFAHICNEFLVHDH